MKIANIQFVRRCFTTTITLLLLSLTLTARAELPPAMAGKALPSLAPMLKKVLPGVVNISVKGDDSLTPSPYGENAGPQRAQPNTQATPPQDQNQGPISPPSSEPSPQNRNPQGGKFTALGSGVIINAKKGFILTNNHVIKNERFITVTLKDGRKFQAHVIGADPASDIAVLQIHAKNLHAIKMADSSKVNVGDFVVAIGSPFGLSQTVTSGIVSALQRTQLGIEGYENFIQTDAPINPGNSGGALLTLNGELIGLNTAIIGPENGSVGIGFAIPSNMASSVAMQLIKYGSVSRGLMGVMVQSFTPNLAQAFGLPHQKGAVVSMVNPHSPASTAGIKTGDIIIKVNGKPIHSAPEITNIIGLTRIGTKIKLTLLRKGKVKNLVVMTTSPSSYHAISRVEDPFFFEAGLRNYSQLNPTHGRVNGVQVMGVPSNEPQALPTSLQPGDIIISANEKPVRTISELTTIAHDVAKRHHSLLINLLRGPKALFIVMKRQR